MEKVEIVASLDRFEEEFAIAYSDDGTKYDMPKVLVPKGVMQGARVRLFLKEGKVVMVKVDRKGAKSLDDKIKERLERLKRGDHLK